MVRLGGSTVATTRSGRDRIGCGIWGSDNGGLGMARAGMTATEREIDAASWKLGGSREAEHGLCLELTDYIGDGARAGLGAASGGSGHGCDDGSGGWAWLLVLSFLLVTFPLFPSVSSFFFFFFVVVQ